MAAHFREQIIRALGAQGVALPECSDVYGQALLAR
jgi:hypothetical protein